MMISPESYYEMNIKGKSKEAIEKEIQSLKQEINRLKRQIKNPSLNPEDLIFPTPRTQLKCNREYLAQAIAAYEAAGGKYIPTKAE